MCIHVKCIIIRDLLEFIYIIDRFINRYLRIFDGILVKMLYHFFK